MTDPQNYQIRPATAGDLGAVVALSQAWAAEGCTPGYPALSADDERLQSWLDGGYFYVGTCQGAVIAFALGVVKLGKNAVFKPEGERFLHLLSVFVDIDHREQGVGDRRGGDLLAKAEAAGVSRSMVGSNNVDWLRTQRFYQRHGYKMFSIEMIK